MEFNGQYLTYEEYKALGGTLDLTPFNLLEFEARRQIDIRTFNRLTEIDSNDIPQAVKICEYNLINSINNYVTLTNGVSETGNAKSESTDGYSITYLTPSEIGEITSSKKAEIDYTIKNYLLGIIVNDEHIMYCGAD